MDSLKLGLQRVIDKDLLPITGQSGDLSWIEHHDRPVGQSCEASLDQVRGLMLRKSIVKKFVGDVKQTAKADEKALAKFHTANDACLTYAIQNPLVRGFPIMETIKLNLFRLWGSISLKGTFADITAGPRASSGAQRYDLMSKIWDSGLPCSDARLYMMFVRQCHSHPLWLEAEWVRLSKHGFKLQPYSTLCFVLKQDDESRIICPEPVLNALYQQALRAQMERALERHFRIKLSVQQSWNRHYAKKGSRTGEYSTVDMTSASDFISMLYCDHMLPRGLFQALMATRSPMVKLPSGELIRVNMMGTMGNATTFPLQTGIFACILSAVYSALGIKEEIIVNGDDIIVRTEAYDELCNALSASGFRVNHKKSFSCGLFRESCGGDYYRGHDVRGVYVKELNCKADFISAFNRLRAWSMKHSISLFNTLLWLRRKIGSTPYVPFDNDGRSGIHSRFDQARRYGRAAYDAVSEQYVYPALATKMALTGALAPCPSAALLAALSGRHTSYPPRPLDSGITMATSLAYHVAELHSMLDGRSTPSVDLENQSSSWLNTSEKNAKVSSYKTMRRSFEWRLS